MHFDQVKPKLSLVTSTQSLPQPLAKALVKCRSVLARNPEQVAAVCYRYKRQKLEFLLVRTRKGRWTFPKGGLIPGLTRAQAAAVEAFEEAGVHGRIEEAAFTQYTLRKGKSHANAGTRTHAHLCEVLRIGTPQESDRSPTWFSPEKAQLRLKEGRNASDGLDLCGVVARAVSRLRRLEEQGLLDPNRGALNADPLRKIEFEVHCSRTDRLIARLDPVPYVERKEGEMPAVVEFHAGSLKALRLSSSRPK